MTRVVMTEAKTFFTIYPAVDLRNGLVVRLQQGDPDRQTIYGDDPAAVARQWLESGAPWLHVVNLDGAFGEQDSANRLALESILMTADEHNARVQMGGGLRSLEAVQQVLEMGVARAVIGTLAVEQPQVLLACMKKFGPERIAVGIDARDGQVQVRGWKTGSSVNALDLGVQMAQNGLKWLIFTDVSRDGTGSGLNLSATVDLARACRIHVIASGGIDTSADLQAAKEAGLAGAIVGRALYERRLTIQDWVDERS